RVDLVEEKPELLHLLQGNHTRWVHPHIYDWPAPGSENPWAGLPLLDWRAASAGEVADQILKQWDRLYASAHHAIAVEKDVRDVLLKPPGRKHLSWQPARGGRVNPKEPHDAVILAVGFGVERPFPPIPLLSYWRDESMHQPSVDSKRDRYFVSGCGD